MLLAGVEMLHDLPSMFLAAADQVHKKTNLFNGIFKKKTNKLPVYKCTKTKKIKK